MPPQHRNRRSFMVKRKGIVERNTAIGRAIKIMRVAISRPSFQTREKLRGNAKSPSIRKSVILLKVETPSKKLLTPRLETKSEPVAHKKDSDNSVRFNDFRRTVGQQNDADDKNVIVAAVF